MYDCFRIFHVKKNILFQIYVFSCDIFGKISACSKIAGASVAPRRCHRWNCNSRARIRLFRIYIAGVVCWRARSVIGRRHYRLTNRPTRGGGRRRFSASGFICALVAFASVVRDALRYPHDVIGYIVARVGVPNRFKLQKWLLSESANVIGIFGNLNSRITT